MNPLLIYVSIAQSIASALFANRGDPAKVAEWTGYLNLASTLVTRWTHGNSDIQALDDQLKQAVAAGRGLTPEERAGWRSRADLGVEIAQQWLADHPKS
jgi:hypothetical protein